MSIVATTALEPQARYELAPPADAAITGRIHVIRGQKVMLDLSLIHI